MSSIEGDDEAGSESADVSSVRERNAPPTPAEARQTLNAVRSQPGQIFMVDGERLTARVSINPAHGKRRPYVTKSQRMQLSAKDKQTFCEKAIKSIEKPFDLISLALDDEEKLTDVYNLSNLIARTKQIHEYYDMDDVFKILTISEDGSQIIGNTSINLYNDYSLINADIIAKSNNWYRNWSSQEYHEENLDLTADYFANNTTDALYNRVNELYTQYDESSRGGPLFFYLMLHQIISDTEDSINSLLQRLRNLKVTDFEGEDIDKVVSLIRGVLARLSSVTPSRVPQDIISILTTIFQTTSDDDFNQEFKSFESNRRFNDLAGGKTIMPTTSTITAEELLRIASGSYRLKVETGQWSGYATKGKETAFFQGKPGENSNNKTKKIVCWNCGTEGHTLQQCPKPRNDQRVVANRALYRKSHPKKKKTPEKWKRPDPSEKNRRVIDGKPMYWNQKSKRWVPDRKPQDGGQVTLAQIQALLTQATSSPPSTTHSVPPVVESHETDSLSPSTLTKLTQQDFDLAVANTARELTQTQRAQTASLQSLSDKFKSMIGS